ncbi:MAG TPA: amidohydrolase [Clostridiales bacterium]|nr:amidohydrolase [Clostridiales bacterium]
MIIDIHTHLVDLDTEFGPQLKQDLTRCGISHDTWRFTEEDYLKGTLEADKAVVFGIKGQKTGWHVSNERVAGFTARHGGKYIFFASVDPLDPKVMDDLKHCHQDLGCKGIKLGPIYQGVHPHHPVYYKIYEYCQENSLPIMTHMATTFSSGVPLEYAWPVHMDKVACDFPNLKIILSHLGHPWIGETLSIIRKQENVYADLSALYYRPWQFYNAMLLAAEYGCGNKILFGSDFPATTTQSSIIGLKNVNKVVEGTNLPKVPLTMIEDIIHRNSLALLGIE